MYQKSLFALFVIITLTVQGCSMAPKTATETPDAAAVATTGTQETPPTPDTTAPTAESTGTAQEVPAQAGLINGTFRFTDKYMTPGGEEPMDVTITLKNSVITAVEAKNVAILPKSVSFQDKFIAGIAGVVVGKNVSDVEITNVNGSSLTAQAFNKALNNLELQ